jgi:hypothetical protein
MLDDAKYDTTENEGVDSSSKRKKNLLDTTEYDNFDIESVAVVRNARKELSTKENLVVYFPAEITAETFKTISLSQLKINDL